MFLIFVHADGAATRNCSVYCNARSKTLLPWTIMKVSEPDYTFRMFFSQEVIYAEDRGTRWIAVAHAGPNKETLDHVDLDPCVQAVVASFGPFVKYRTALSSESRPSIVVSHNALALLMSSARSIATADMAQRVERNSKDRLYNDTLEVCSIKYSSDTKLL